MKIKINKITVIGDGGWGTTLAILLARKNLPVCLWGPFPDYLKEIRKARVNQKYLPGVRVPSNIEIVEDLRQAIIDADLIVFAIPSKYAQAILRQIKAIKADFKNKIFLNVTKGVATNKMLRISELTEQILGPVNYAILSGPTIAGEVAREIPSTAVVACRNMRIAKLIQGLFNSPYFRIYTNTDIVAVELGGSVKNIIAIACGVSDGLGFGTNTKAAILTRGLAEMSRLGVKLGAREKTFAGLSGLGDLVTTASSLNSRNRFVGEELGKGKNIKQILSKMQMVAEGVDTVKAVNKLSQKLNVPMPITQEVYNIIYRNKKPLKALTSLMTRKTKSE